MGAVSPEHTGGGGRQTSVTHRLCVRLSGGGTERVGAVSPEHTGGASDVSYTPSACPAVWWGYRTGGGCVP